MKDYTQLKIQKSLIEKHISFLKEQYVAALLTDGELFQQMDEASKALRKVTKQLNS